MWKWRWEVVLHIDPATWCSLFETALFTNAQRLLEMNMLCVNCNPLIDKFDWQIQMEGRTMDPWTLAVGHSSKVKLVLFVPWFVGMNVNGYQIFWSTLLITFSPSRGSNLWRLWRCWCQSRTERFIQEGLRSFPIELSSSDANRFCSPQCFGSNIMKVAHAMTNCLQMSWVSNRNTKHDSILIMFGSLDTQLKLA